MKNKLLLIVIAFYSIHMAAMAQAESSPYPSSCYQDFCNDGAWCWFSDPRAVHYEGKHKRTYVGFVSSKGDITVATLDHVSNEKQEHVVYPKLQRDDHVNPSLLFLPDGRLMIFFTRHNGGLYYTTTKKAEDISAWEEVQLLDMGKMLCYSNPVLLSEENNRIYVFFRGGYNWKPSFVTSDDLGKTWSDPHVLVGKPGATNTNRPYTKVVSDGRSRIWFAFTDGHPRNEPLNSIYTMYYEGGKIYQVNGEELCSLDDLPLDQHRVMKSYDAIQTTVRSWIWDLALDDNGYPVMVYTQLNEETSHQYYYGLWNGSEWVSYHITEGGQDFPRKDWPKEQRNPEPHYSGGIILDHNNPNAIYLSKPVNNVFEIFKYTTSDFGKTWDEQSITSKSKKDNVRPFVVRGEKSQEEGLVFWMENRHYEHYTNYDAAIKMNRLQPQLNSELEPAAIKAAMKKVADWQVNTPLRHNLADWTNGALYAGMVEWAKMADDEFYFEWLKKIGVKNTWSYMVRQNPKGRYHADDYCVGQMYVELYRHYGHEGMIQPMIDYFNLMLDRPSTVDLAFDFSNDRWPTERWSWCDALFMAPTVWIKMAKETGNKKYLKFMYNEYKATTDYLFDEEEGLYFRDSRYFDKKEANGAKMFWGRGNGWVFGGLPIILKELPEDYKKKDYFETIYLKMAHKISSLQDEKGYWHASMLDPDSYPNPETSSSAFFVYGLAWGVNNGYLDKATYQPIVEKGWKALIEAVWPDGKLGWVQPIGENPKNVTAEMTEVYGVGAFLLAGSEVYKMK
jgi:rhamnogalacturonyl hydrolase YesR